MPHGSNPNPTASSATTRSPASPLILPQAPPTAAEPGGDTSFLYYRLHGSPRTYYSEYTDEFLRHLAARISPHPNAWIIFDNTAAAHAFGNALQLRHLIESNLLQPSLPADPAFP